MTLPPLPPIDPATIRTIAVIKTDHIGDLIMATPIFAALRKHFTQAKITAVTGVWARGVLQNNPNVDREVSYYPEWLDKNLKGFDPEKHRHNQKTLLELAAEPFDLVVNLRDDYDSLYHLNIYLAGLICGRYLLSLVKEPSHLMLVTHPVAYRPGRFHVLERNIHLLEAIGVPVPELPALYPSAEDEDWAEKALAGAPFWVAIASGAGWAGKQWPLENFAAVTDALHARKIPVVYLGGQGEYEFAQKMAEQFGVLNLCGKTQLLTLASVLKRVTVLLNSDSGPAHIAACMGTRIVDIIQPPAQIEFAPLTTKCELLTHKHCFASCSYWHFGWQEGTPVEPCACVRAISVERVLRSIYKALVNAFDSHELVG